MKTVGNTILITDGTSGIGLGLARRFHAAGNQVIVAGRRGDLLGEITGAHHDTPTMLTNVSHRVAS